MKTILTLAATLAALAGAAAAQPAWTPSRDGPPQGYPPCQHDVQDRCQQTWSQGDNETGPAADRDDSDRFQGQDDRGYGSDDRSYGYQRHSWRHHRHHHHHSYDGHSSYDGERG